MLFTKTTSFPVANDHLIEGWIAGLQAADGQEVIRRAREVKPDLVLMDVRMPVMNGVGATRQLKAEMPGLKVITLTIFDVQEYGEAVMVSGASSYVIKKCLIKDLLPAARGAFASRAPGFRGTYHTGGQDREGDMR
jgi:DNA-binding NarL/FixJ family response regulator